MIPKFCVNIVDNTDRFTTPYWGFVLFTSFIPTSTFRTYVLLSRPRRGQQLTSILMCRQQSLNLFSQHNIAAALTVDEDLPLSQIANFDSSLKNLAGRVVSFVHVSSFP
jgi:hypothetical protein